MWPRRRRRPTAPPILVTQCACQAWQLDLDPAVLRLPIWLVRGYVAEALDEHQAECPDLELAHLVASHHKM